MNNQQFRRLVLEQSGSSGSSNASSPKHGGAQSGGATPALGSRQRSSIPMTPRAVGGGSSGVDLVRQLRQQQQQEGPPTKRFKASAAPKGSKLAAGYVDRAKNLRESEEGMVDDKAQRVKALEEQFKLGQIEQSLFEKLRDEIVGGDVNSVHLVKGLDRRLLERVRRGEDVLSEKPENEEKGKAEEEEDVDAALDEMGSRDLKPLSRAEKSYVADMAPPPAPGGKKRTRNEILQEMKAARARAVEEQAATQPALGSKFRRIGAEMQPNTSRVEVDGKGREVLIVVDAEGNVKRKVRKAKTGHSETARNGLLMPEKGAVPLGMVVPELPAPPTTNEEEGEDIFTDAGSDYDPLGEAGADATDSASDYEAAPPRHQSASRSPPRSPPDSEPRSSPSRSPPTHRSAVGEPAQPSSSTRRNYFGAAPSHDAAPPSAPPANPMHDPAMLAALKRAAALAGTGDEESDAAAAVKAEAAKKARHAAMLATANGDRDLDDMDLGFGESRLGDGEEYGGKLTEWGTDEARKEGWEKRGGQGQRKRGKKKKKGDGNNVSDVMSVLERRR